MNPKNVIQFAHLIEELKLKKRTGWINSGIELPESISDHMHRMSLLALLAPPTLNKSRCVEIASTHDIAESIVGDITPFDGISKQEKHSLEADAMTRIQDMLGNTEHAKHIHELWLEYENCSSDEARFVKDLDKVEMLIQAFEYEKSTLLDVGGVFL
ncbi:hypothetical protein SmJEL517_g00799 [Synchytrium microbalum]|uniref:5'-deoxynucleotidase n=1 Tax=Synchytrium microbalum TaxID=1806994 RepID=A0A507C6F5_9FUNG|nr:uncharacterized protein SmJEL517_g00799 [Synchytrium microbalum]TPX37170.1 hypothetical protein SmJEL517_g00799 [Synchytrium microbalum]